MLPAPALLAIFQLAVISDPFQTIYTPALPFIGLGLMISVLVTAIMYMLGNALQSQEILAMGKDNLANLIFSAVIVVLFVFLFTTLSAITSAAAGAPDHIEAAYQSVILLRSKLFSLYTQLYLYELLFGFLSTIGFSIPIPALSPATMLSMLITIPSLSFSPLSGLTPISNAHIVVVEAVGTAVLMVLARQVLLEFISNYMYIFFIIGVCMRAFSFTRKTGSSVLALAAVAYFVYPLTVLFSNYMIFHVYQPTNFGVVPTAIGYCENPETIKTLSTELGAERSALYNSNLQKNPSRWYMFWSFLNDAIDFVGSSAKMMLNVLFSFNGYQILKMVLSPVAFSTFFDFLVLEIQTMVQFLVLVFSAFFFEVVITITMYRSIAMFMEGETEIFGISKLM